MGRRTLLLIAAMLVAALATGLVWLYVQGADARARQRNALVGVLVAAREVPAGTTVADLAAQVTTVQVPSGAVPPGGLSSLADLQNPDLVTLDTLHAGQFVVQTALSDEANAVARRGGWLVTLALGEAARSASVLTVGTTVDVYVTLPGREGDECSARAREVVGDLRVAAIGAATETGTTEASSLVSVDLTDPAQARELLLVQKEHPDSLWLVVNGQGAPDTDAGTTGPTLRQLGLCP